MAGLCLLLLAAPAGAQQPGITLVVNYVAGGATDILARILQPALSEEWGAQVIIKNSAGASGTIGGAEVARARPDGLTLLLSPSGGSIVAPNFMRPAPYTIAAFAPICQVVDTPLVTMTPTTTGLRTVADYLARARAADGGYPYSTAGVGSGPHLAMIAFTRLTGVAFNHIPFRGGGEAVQAMFSGTVETLSDQASLVRQYGLHPVVVWSRERAAQFPDTPTMRESGFALDFDIWTALYAPAGTPEPLLARYEAGCARALRNPSVVAGIGRIDMNIRWRDRATLAAYLAAEDAKYRTLIEGGNLRRGE
jgi:tripartite-type tricarboxylate transporter receptor subunit TctC